MKGHIRQRSPGHWAIVLEMRDASIGERKRKWHSFTGTKREAQVECARLVAEIHRGTYLEPAKTTVAQFLERWLESTKANVAPRTHERYAEIVRTNIVPLIGTAILSKLKPVRYPKPTARPFRKVAATARGDCRLEPCCTCTGCSSRH
jgi:Phage integrase, N-terminal SAM-like domain